MRLTWSWKVGAAFWASTQAADSAVVRLLVEELPDGRWDWTVWKNGGSGGSRYGVSTSCDAAMAIAEAAADDLASVPDASAPNAMGNAKD